MHFSYHERGYTNSGTAIIVRKDSMVDLKIIKAQTNLKMENVDEGRVTYVEFRQFHFIASYAPNTVFGGKDREKIRESWDQGFFKFVNNLN